MNKFMMNRRGLMGLASAASMAGIIASVNDAMAQNATSPTATDLPKEWKDKISGKRVLRISRLDNSKSLYFHDNAFTRDGRYMVMDTPEGIAVYDFHNHTLNPLSEKGYSSIMVSRGKNVVYARKYNGPVITKDNGNVFKGLEYFEIEIPTGKKKSLGVVENGYITSFNADDTLMTGAFAKRFYELQPGPKVANTDGGYNALDKNGKPMTFAAAKELRMADRLAQNIPMEIFTIDLKTGKRKTVTASNDWLNHVQFSPTDPKKIMYCHEGPWHMVDRVWMVNTDGTGKTNVHKRTMNMEIAGHEYFSPDGSKILYDLQTPRGEDFWLASYDIKTKEKIWYHLERDEWSVHYQSSPDGKLFYGDGGDNEMVARAKDGKYIYLFEPEIIEDIAVSAPNAAELIRPGKLISKKLVDMNTHDYRVEPNLHISPDGKWLVFRSNMHGPIHTYAVEL